MPNIAGAKWGFSAASMASRCVATSHIGTVERQNDLTARVPANEAAALSNQVVSLGVTTELRRGLVDVALLHVGTSALDSSCTISPSTVASVALPERASAA